MTTSTERTSRGYMITSSVAYIEKAYDRATQEKILNSMPERIRSLIANVDKVGWYPVEDVAEIFRAVANHHHATDGRVLEALEGVGRSIGETATNTFLKLVLKLLTPSLFASKMGRFWPRDNRCGTLKCTEFNEAEKLIRAELTGMTGYDFIGPVVAGFLLYTLEGLGLKSSSVTYPWNFEVPGPDAIVYEYRWR